MLSKLKSFFILDFRLRGQLEKKGPSASKGKRRRRKNQDGKPGNI